MSELFCETISVSCKNFSALVDHTSCIKLFKIKLSSYEGLVTVLSLYLSKEELNRSQRYHFKKDKNQFIICRILLKFILSQHTRIPVHDIKIAIDDYKKPFLVNTNLVCFNISHSNDYAIIAVTNIISLGVDIEYINEDFGFSEIVKDIYNSQEINNIVQSDNKANIFFKYWTRKESIVKATGLGISDYLIEIPATDGKHAVSKRILNNLKHLRVFSFNLNKKYWVSLAITDKYINLKDISIYNLPTNMEQLLSFTFLKSNVN